MRLDRAECLWIEADPLSGGSRSQVEFPVELGAFFGGTKRPVTGEAVDVAVEHAGIRFPDKKLDFHHNQVWRLNLPTRRQGIGDYQGTTLVFQKTPTNRLFRLWVVPPTGRVTRLLKSRAKRARSLGGTRRADRSLRRFGFF